MNENIRNVRFVAPQDAADLYYCPELKRHYLRQRCDKAHVRWLTTSKWSGGFEPCAPLKPGITFRVINKRDKVVFEETQVHKDGYDAPVAEKVGFFSDEALKQVAESVVKKAALLSYESWKKALMQTAEEYNFRGYSDNWLYDAEYGDVRTLFSFEYLGEKAYCTAQTATHKVSGQTWQCVELRDNFKTNVLEICGYKMN